MGDLIIKPEAGGSIKLQNNAGTNALVSDNSGNITVGGALGVTGSVTLSGTANNLGTATAGTLSSGITFPAGHVIKIDRTENNTRTVINTVTGRHIIWTVVYNKLLSSSKLLIQWHLAGWGSSGDTTLWECYAGPGSWTRGPMAYDQDTSGSTRVIFNNFLLADCTSTGNQNIGLAYNTSNNSSNKPFNIWNPGSSEDARNNGEISTCIVTEITT